ncbi:unnamed protein product [Closterium sp. NIES-53]
MAGLSDDEADADLDDADSVAIEEARTGLDLLLRSLGRPFPPPAPTAPGPVPMVPENPDVPSSPDSIRANPPASPSVSDTVHIGTSASKSSATRAIKLKQQKLSFWTSSTSVPLSEAAVNETTAHPALNINVQELIDAIYAEALEKYKSKWVERFPWLLDLVSLHGQIKHTTSHIESRYVDCGDDFGGGLSRWLSPFIERYGPGKEREVTVEGPDSDGRPSTFVSELHEEKVKGYVGPCDHDACVEVCTDFAERIVGNLERRLSDLDSLSGVHLFLPDEWPKSKLEHHARCVEWLNSLVTLFKAHAA